MSIEYTHIPSLTTQQFEGRLKALDAEGARVITVAVQSNGDLTVLSPYDANWTQQFLIVAGIHLPVAMSVN